MSVLILDKTPDGNIILNYKFFIRLAIVGFIGDILFNYWTSQSDAKNGPIKGLKDFYDSTSWYSAAFWAAVIFVIIVLITVSPELIYNLF